MPTITQELHQPTPSKHVPPLCGLSDSHLWAHVLHKTTGFAPPATTKSTTHQPPNPHKTTRNSTTFWCAAEAPALWLSITGLPRLLEIGQESHSTLRSGTQSAIGL